MGAGQRSSLLFSALSRIGSTWVVVLGYCDPARVAESFPGHVGLTQTGTRLYDWEGTPSWLTVWLARLRRFTLFGRHYRVDPAARAQISALLEGGARVVAFRYFRSYCLSGIDRSHPTAPLVLVDVDDRDDQRLASSAAQMFRQPALRWLFDLIVLRRVRALMRRRLGAADFTWFVTDEDSAGFEAVPNAVLRNVPFIDPGPVTPPPPSAAQNMLFVGSAGYRPNVDGLRWFLTYCWPEIHRRHPQATFRLVGLFDWAKQMREFAGLPGLEVVGFVEDLASEYARARAVVAPILEGGGSKIKVIEACAFGRPVVALRHSARGFGPEITGILAVADGPQDFIEACGRFLADPDLADRTGTTLRALQQTQFSRAAMEAQIVGDILQALAGNEAKR
ncbi:glycosyltransferase family 4 protein [Pararhodobacter sp. SW119]|uniref:glycosyltransferase family 4 protein n=1 Tax=Pararhodobacter sp. SW119 TaxID=2780075 RepID=UPI001AE0C4A2|nr:glycosyltransferase family 4 protein [Pararhodobacter sp. SW119]